MRRPNHHERVPFMNDEALDTGIARRRIGRGMGTTGLLLLAFVAILVVFMLMRGFEDSLNALAQVGVGGILLLLGLSGSHYVLRALRWHLLVQTAGVGTGVAQNVRHFFGGFAMTATPGRVGELVRLRWLKMETGGRLGVLAPIVYADRALELASLVAVLVGAAALANLGSGAVVWVLVSGFAMVSLTCFPSLLESMLVGIWRIIGRRRPRLFVKLRRVVRDLNAFTVPTVALPNLALGCLGWMLEGFAFWLLLDWLGASISFWAATAIFLIALLSGALLGFPGGLGGVEASAVLLLVIQNVPSETAIIATLVIRVTTLWFAVALGILVFPLAEYRAQAAGDRATKP